MVQDLRVLDLGLGLDFSAHSTNRARGEQFSDPWGKEIRGVCLRPSKSLIHGAKKCEGCVPQTSNSLIHGAKT
jgi:hypothetical protein